MKFLIRAAIFTTLAALLCNNASSSKLKTVCGDAASLPLTCPSKYNCGTTGWAPKMCSSSLSPNMGLSQYIHNGSLSDDDCDYCNWTAPYEGCCLYAYKDTHKPPIATIGVGFNIDAQQHVLESFGYNVKDLCDGTAGLKLEHIGPIYKVVQKSMVDEVRGIFPSFDSQCCSTRLVLVDLLYNLGEKGSKPFKPFRSMIENCLWDFAAKDLLRNTTMCDKEAAKNGRCIKNFNSLSAGCSSCLPSCGQAKCDGAAGCCASAYACCAGTMTFDHGVENVTGCCPESYPECCGPSFPHGGCMEELYTKCCWDAKHGTGYSCFGISGCGTDGVCALGSTGGWVPSVPSKKYST